jgi:hypothetical protein
MNIVCTSVVLAFSIVTLVAVAGCSSTSSGGAAGAVDSGASDGASAQDAGGSDGATSDAAGDAGATVGGSGSLTGTYGAAPIKPVVAAYWVGKPGNPAESGGGPFVYVFSGPVTCDDLSHGSGWVARLPPDTQVLEMIIGTTTVGTAVPAAAHAAGGAAEINYALAPSSTESRATTGSVTLSAYNAGASVDGTVTAAFPMGSVTGTFHASYCANGNEF